MPPNVHPAAPASNSAVMPPRPIVKSVKASRPAHENAGFKTALKTTQAKKPALEKEATPEQVRKAASKAQQKKPARARARKDEKVGVERHSRDPGADPAIVASADGAAAESVTRVAETPPPTPAPQTVSNLTTPASAPKRTGQTIQPAPSIQQFQPAAQDETLSDSTQPADMPAPAVDHEHNPTISLPIPEPKAEARDETEAAEVEQQSRPEEVEPSVVEARMATAATVPIPTADPSSPDSTDLTDGPQESISQAVPSPAQQVAPPLQKLPAETAAERAEPEQGRAPETAAEPLPAEVAEQTPDLPSDQPMSADALPEPVKSAKAVTTEPPHVPTATAPAAPQPRPQDPIPAPLPEAAFAQANHPSIISGIRTHLLPNGGSVQIRLEPPELGALLVQINLRDGIVTASFQTSSDDATRLLSHSLGQLKLALESQGVSVEKLQVQQAPREHFDGHMRDDSHQQHAQDQSLQQEQQRREMLRRMWQRLAGRDELDLFA